MLKYLFKVFIFIEFIDVAIFPFSTIHICALKLDQGMDLRVMHVCGVKMPTPFNYEFIGFKDLFTWGREFCNKK